MKQYGKQAYEFNRETNTYHFSKGFQKFCKKFLSLRKKQKNTGLA